MLSIKNHKTLTATSSAQSADIHEATNSDSFLLGEKDRIVNVWFISRAGQAGTIYIKIDGAATADGVDMLELPGGASSSKIPVWNNFKFGYIVKSGDGN